MRMLKGFALVAVGLFTLVTLISLLIPGNIVVTRAVSVHADSLKLFNEISNLKNWQHWHPVFKSDSAAFTFSDANGSIGSSAGWLSGAKKTLLVVQEKQYPFVKVALTRAGENDVINILSLLPVQEQGNMQVQWTSVTQLDWYPWEKFGGIFTEKMTGPGYESALQALKVYVESHP